MLHLMGFQSPKVVQSRKCKLLTILVLLKVSNWMANNAKLNIGRFQQYHFQVPVRGAALCTG